MRPTSLGQNAATGPTPTRVPEARGPGPARPPLPPQRTRGPSAHDGHSCRFGIVSDIARHGLPKAHAVGRGTARYSPRCCGPWSASMRQDGRQLLRLPGRCLPDPPAAALPRPHQEALGDVAQGSVAGQRPAPPSPGCPHHRAVLRSAVGGTRLGRLPRGADSGHARRGRESCPPNDGQCRAILLPRQALPSPRSAIR